MEIGVTSSIFFISIGSIILLLFLRYVEVSWRFRIISNIFRLCDPFVQAVVSRLSVTILRVSTKIKHFVLIHIFHISSETVRAIFRETMDRKATLLQKLRGNRPRLATERLNENVSPYLRAISNIDRKG